MRYFDTFTGIGGFSLGIQQAYDNLLNRHKTPEEQQATSKDLHRGNVYTRSELLERTPTCVGYSEIDKYAGQVYDHHFPNHKNYGDITKIDERRLPDFDLFCGGFPCQSFSIAGKRGGFEDTRGTLFFDIARIAKHKQPRLILLENVKGLLSHDGGRTFNTIIATLTELGYDCQWQVLNSKNHGVPQNRERVFIIGHLRGTRRPQVFPFTSDGGPAHELPRHVSNTLTRRYEGAQAVGTYIGGGELDAQVVKIPEATKKGYAEAHVGQAINLAVPTSATRRGRVSDIAPTVDTGMQLHTLTENMQIRRLTPMECERLQGFPDNWTEYGAKKKAAEIIATGKHIGHKGKRVSDEVALERISDTQRYKMCGNAVTVNVIADIMEKLL